MHLYTRILFLLQIFKDQIKNASVHLDISLSLIFCANCFRNKLSFVVFNHLSNETDIMNHKLLNHSRPLI